MWGQLSPDDGDMSAVNLPSFSGNVALMRFCSFRENNWKSALGVIRHKSRACYSRLVCSSRAWWRSTRLFSWKTEEMWPILNAHLSISLSLVLSLCLWDECFQTWLLCFSGWKATVCVRMTETHVSMTSPLHLATLGHFRPSCRGQDGLDKELKWNIDWGAILKSVWHLIWTHLFEFWLRGLVWAVEKPKHYFPNVGGPKSTQSLTWIMVC